MGNEPYKCGVEAVKSIIPVIRKFVMKYLFSTSNCSITCRQTDSRYNHRLLLGFRKIFPTHSSNTSFWNCW